MSIAGELAEASEVKEITASAVLASGGLWLHNLCAYRFPDGSYGQFDGWNRDVGPRFIEVYEG